ncbi:MAG TPA: XrtA/PEP-CTERM system amidotransferase [Rhizomicrobium sp.]|jgi:asparagine synthase (glutamine-hydrolysing)|nr:XrtA/PEP-CTERM system amidotransferase [Rhizomicrobium sp.]
MCGISGWFDTQGERPPNKGLLKAMNDAIYHRGPDGEGFHFAPGIAFGHRRLAIIDLSTGDQPKFDESGNICIVFNGEIFNYRELRKELQEKQHRFLTASDTEVILEAWKEWGRDCVNRLSGQFAFALWDTKERTLFLARDRLGEKPLYYAFLPDRTFIFGSELKALAQHPDLPRKIDPCAIEEFFALGYICDPRTIYEGVQKLPPGHTLTITRGQAPKLAQYWDPKPGHNDCKTFDDAAHSLLGRLSAAVKSQLVADVPVGAFLSGGTDSSATMSLMAKACSHPVECFTIGFDDPKFDERPYAAQVAQRYGGRQHIEVMTGHETDIVELLPGIFDEPFGDSSALPTYQVAKLASRHVKVSLSGDAGDELFAGYRRYAFHGREEALRNLLPQAVRRPVFGLLGAIYPQIDWAPRIFRARQTFRELSQDTAHGYFHNVSVVSDDLRSRLYSDSLRKDLAGYHAVDVIERHLKNAPLEDPVGKAQYVDLKTWLVGDILVKVDRTAMANSLETRVPMLDPRFVEWALALKPEFKLANGEGKRVLKRALEPLLPHDLLYRSKQGFSVPLADWFRGTMGEHFRLAMQGEGGLAASGYFNIGMIDTMIAQHRTGARDHSRTLWLLWMFQRFLERETAAPAKVAASV